MGAAVEVVVAAAASRLRRRLPRRCAVAASAEHPEIGGDDFKTSALLAFFVLPFAGLNAAFDEEQRTLFQILLGDFGLFAPNDNFVPLGALLAFAVAVFIGFVCGDGKIRDGLAAAGVTGFGVAAQAADENDFVNGHFGGVLLTVGQDNTRGNKREMTGCARVGRFFATKIWFGCSE